MFEPEDPFPQHSAVMHSPAEAETSFRLKKTVSIEISDRCNEFRRRYFPLATPNQWNDWRWQLRNRICSFEQIKKMFHLSKSESDVFTQGKITLPFSITPYYAALIDEDNPLDPIRRTVIPTIDEATLSAGESIDPLHEGNDSPVDGLVHRYPDRALFLVTHLCSTYCRYCTRSRIVGHETGKQRMTRDRWENALAYIEAHKEIRDVILSGGDPLLLPAEALEWLLARLRAIPHIDIIRLGTKVPMVLPQRITRPLISMLKRYHPLYMSIHCTHPTEHTIEAIHACSELADAGIPLGSQTVLLSGINDSAETMKQLYHGLLKMRIRPYYLYQCDPIAGSSHFRTPVQKGIDIIRSLRGFTSGYAIPHYVIDAPGGGGKIPISPDYIISRNDTAIVMRNYEDKNFVYPENGEYKKAQFQQLSLDF
jgi:lysine 2,3-aminomutase